jgi:hypothetical protein
MLSYLNNLVFRQPAFASLRPSQNSRLTSNRSAEPPISAALALYLVYEIAMPARWGIWLDLLPIVPLVPIVGLAWLARLVRLRHGRRA